MGFARSLDELPAAQTASKMKPTLEDPIFSAADTGQCDIAANDSGQKEKCESGLMETVLACDNTPPSATPSPIDTNPPSDNTPTPDIDNTPLSATPAGTTVPLDTNDLSDNTTAADTNHISNASNTTPPSDNTPALDNDKTPPSVTPADTTPPVETNGPSDTTLPSETINPSDSELSNDVMPASELTSPSDNTPPSGDIQEGKPVSLGPVGTVLPSEPLPPIKRRFQLNQPRNIDNILLTSLVTNTSADNDSDNDISTDVDNDNYNDTVLLQSPELQPPPSPVMSEYSIKQQHLAHESTADQHDYSAVFEDDNDNDPQPLIEPDPPSLLPNMVQDDDDIQTASPYAVTTATAAEHSSHSDSSGFPLVLVRVKKFRRRLRHQRRLDKRLTASDHNDQPLINNSDDRKLYVTPQSLARLRALRPTRLPPLPSLSTQQ